MDNIVLEKFDTYFETLPQSVQEIAFDESTMARIKEIAKKYQLDPAQTESLGNLSSLVITGVITEDELVSVISEDLVVSNLISEQIKEDLENRVFEYAFNYIEKKSSKYKQRGEKNITIEGRRTVKNLPIDELTHTENITPEGEVGIPSYIPKSSGTHILSNEPVQKPIPVPRFTASPLADLPKPAEPVKKVETINIIESKLKNVTTGTQIKSEPQMPSTKYSVDPYREPLE